MDTCVCVTETLHCSAETIPTFWIGCTPMQNTKVKKCKDLKLHYSKTSWVFPQQVVTWAWRLEPCLCILFSCDSSTWCYLSAESVSTELAPVCGHGITDFFFFYNGPYSRFIYLEMEGSHSYRPEAMVPIKQFNFFLLCHDFSLLLGSTSNISSHTLYGSRGVIQGLQYCSKWWKKWELRERERDWSITFCCSMKVTGKMNCSCGDD